MILEILIVVAVSLALMACFSRNIAVIDVGEAVYDFCKKVKDSFALLAEMCKRGGRTSYEEPRDKEDDQ